MQLSHSEEELKPVDVKAGQLISDKTVELIFYLRNEIINFSMKERNNQSFTWEYSKDAKSPILRPLRTENSK